MKDPRRRRLLLLVLVVGLFACAPLDNEAVGLRPAWRRLLARLHGFPKS